MRRELREKIVQKVGPAGVVDALAPFVTEQRRARIDRVVAGRLFDLHVGVEAPYDPFNAAAVVRSAEALGAGGVHVIAAGERVLHSKRTTAGTYHWLETRSYADIEGFFAVMRERGMAVAAACVDGETDLTMLPVDRPLCLLLGNESRGLTDQAKDLADVRYRINTPGFAESLNVSVCAALSLYDVSSRRRASLGRKGDGDATRQLKERARFYIHSVDDRLARGLLDPADRESATESITKGAHEGADDPVNT